MMQNNIRSVGGIPVSYGFNQPPSNVSTINTAIAHEQLKALENGSILIFNTWGLKNFQPLKKISCGYCN